MKQLPAGAPTVLPGQSWWQCSAQSRSRCWRRELPRTGCPAAGAVLAPSGHIKAMATMVSTASGTRIQLSRTTARRRTALRPRSSARLNKESSVSPCECECPMGC